MKILLLGATGRTGKLVIEEALRRGYKISAIARYSEKLRENPPKMVLSRNSAAEFFIKIIENKEHIRETLYLSNKGTQSLEGTFL